MIITIPVDHGITAQSLAQWKNCLQAETAIIKSVQREAYKEELNCIGREKRHSKEQSSEKAEPLPGQWRASQDRRAA